MRFPRRGLLTAFVVLAFVLAVPASASANAAVLADARDGSVECRHSPAALQNALSRLSPEEREYSDMDEAIRTAITKKRSG